MKHLYCKICVLCLLSVVSCYSQNKLFEGYGFDEIIYIERAQYAPDHHNTETLFQAGEINADKFRGGSSLRALNVHNGSVRTIIDSPEGVVRDPELSFDGTKIIFSWRKNIDDWFHIYEIGTDGSGLHQLTAIEGVSDIDPLYLPDGGIVFSSSRQPKYCMCNRHIMCNLYRMDGDGANITQIGKSTLFEGHTSLLNDGRLIYDRWEYVDRNFANAQALWTVNPDGTKHAIYYGNNTKSPDGVIDARAIVGTDLVVAIFGACHDRPWGAMAVIDRRLGVDDVDPVIKIFPDHAKEWIGGRYGTDKFAQTAVKYEDPFPLDRNNIMVSRSIGVDSVTNDHKMAIYMVSMDGHEELIVYGVKSLFDPMPIVPRFRPATIPFARDFGSGVGTYYVQNVYEGTHMTGVEKGSVKFLRVIESPEKRSWTAGGWGGEGEQAPAMNWHSFENKIILGEVQVAEDGSAYFEVPAGKYVYFQLLDKDRKMVQSMRSGTTALSGEVNGCIGCHENRLSIPIPSGNTLMALRGKPNKMEGWYGKIREFSYARDVQPILTKNCIQCHDFDQTNRSKLVLAADRNHVFNASYIELYQKKYVTLIGGGPAEIQQPRSWGSSASRLTSIIDADHHNVKLTDRDRKTIYAWLDLNGVYYPKYESAYPDSPAGRSPLTWDELNKLGKLCDVNFAEMNAFYRSRSVQISFDRPAESPCLDAIRNDKERYDQALSLITEGGKRLAKVPRADMDGFIPCAEHREQLGKYDELLRHELRMNEAIRDGRKIYETAQ